MVDSLYVEYTYTQPLRGSRFPLGTWPLYFTIQEKWDVVLPRRVKAKRVSPHAHEERVAGETHYIFERHEPWSDVRSRNPITRWWTRRQREHDARAEWFIEW